MTTGSHQFSQETVTAAASPGRSASRLDSGYVTSGKFDGVGGIWRWTCFGPPRFTNRALGRPLSRQARLPVFRIVTRAIPPCSRAMNFTWPGDRRAAAERHAVLAGVRAASCGGTLATHGTAGPAAACGFCFEPESQPAASASTSRQRDRERCAHALMIAA